MTWLALLLLHLVTGGLLVGHSARMVFGAFGRKRIEATGQSFRKLGLEPAPAGPRPISIDHALGIKTP